jgi:predicted nucleotidyltransferase component of viral defense system
LNTSPDAELVQLIAADLGVDASFIEKDWYAMRIIAALIAANISGIRLVFSGGTSLSKGFGLIQRFSEDLDFKVVLPETGLNRRKRTNYRNQIVDAICIAVTKAVKTSW